ncbi:symmetrical bis(5'-nucleosyl)-tetraphosphatase [Chitinimonas sp. BJB300]|uniref:symmetrical bis(5'-nucleosyl)-tetraphosphatase n=1 Tax=Chitinimonas sp. BJB300 TaxID=1559339 RepID=UPI000C1144D4|nr:symmetrical bis(5'-nucleosyl)-tetraphosphatase [Chitinimonas sp. BJB300]PHV10351.1 diadenosine tetraphosphatase [Chitinimonas sp. BJB300]TSJ90829.1 symmetrical bis(5'-nucleosyl)-tetraphosphatase [Chitinimonas sp. BJB300]
MANYVIGDIQGCYAELMSLLNSFSFNPTVDKAYLVGDLVNRGPNSLEVLRWVYANRESVRMVLGNHDLHFLAVGYGLVRQKKGDTLSALLAAPDCNCLLNWLRIQPLVRQVGQYIIVHAGLLPLWTIGQALTFSSEVGFVLAGEGYCEFLSKLYGNQPAKWKPDLMGVDRLRLIVNICTRMRMVDSNCQLDLGFKGELSDAPANLYAWFDIPNNRNDGSVLVFGHWSALGLLQRDDIIALDTGCVWGGALTAIRLEDKQVFQVPSSLAPQFEGLGAHLN